MEAIITPHTQDGREPLLLDVHQVAERFGVSVGSIRELIRTGRLRHVRVGRLVKVPTSALRDFLAA